LVHEFPATGSAELLQDQGACGGVCVGDFDGDGWPDLFVANYDRGNRLYRNRGGFRFEDVTAQAGVAAAGRWGGGVAAVDLDGDGDLDLAVSVFNAPNLIFLNRGDGVFQEQAAGLGLDYTGASVMLAFGDYDLDGFLDAYLLTHRLSVGAEHRLPRSTQESLARAVLQYGPDRRLTIHPRFEDLFGLMPKGPGRAELFIAGQPDQLFRSLGGTRFTNVSQAAGLEGHDIGLSATWWDYNQDGWPDLYVSNDYKGPDRLYRNQGNGTFVDVARETLPHVPWSSMGADTADINNDGRPDLLATEMAGSTHVRRQMILDDFRERWFLETAEPRQYPRNALYLATGTERLMEVAFLAGLAGTDWTWSPKFADFDNDGWVDLFVANGMSRDYINADLLGQMRERGHQGWRNLPVLREANLAFRNLGDLRFASIGPAWGLDQVSASFGAAVADLDRDGDLDLVVTSLGEPVALYRNDERARHRVLVRLKGTRSNSWGLHATVRLETEAGTQVRCLGLTSGFMSANEPLVHFGLAHARRIRRLTISWPSGHEQSFQDLVADQFYTVTEPSTAPPPRPAPRPSTPFFRPLPLPAALQHREANYDDFQREPLLPWRLSRWGPGLAVGDVNGDGTDDLFLSGAAGDAGQIALAEPGGVFRLHPQPCFEADKTAEDLGALLFDADADGDLDLYVVSGSVECNPGDSSLRDRLYLNDGTGTFARAPEAALPDDRKSGTVVVAADFDRDGDLDLFVGSRSAPGNYPLPSANRLLLNEREPLPHRTDAGGPVSAGKPRGASLPPTRFRDATLALAPALAQSGLVTSAVWSDANDDGWPDLLVTHEWGPVKFFLNAGGRLEDRTAEAGLAERTGWWNGIAAADLDEDGDMDYVVTNLGLNTRYTASSQRPALLFRGDFDDSGQLQFIEACFDGDRLVPRRSLPALADAIPSLAARFPTVRAFADASLAEVLSPARLDAAQRFAVNTLESGVLLNDGRARFTFQPLPRLAQAAPGFGLGIADVDGDSHLDVLLAQNFHGPPADTGRFDGTVGWMLRGSGDGTFAPVWPDQSGFVVPGDARALVVTDFDRDGWPDVLIGVNHDNLLAFQNCAPRATRRLLVELVGQSGNPTGVGSRVKLVMAEGGQRVAEVHAGGGYLSQSAAQLSFVLRPGERPSGLEVRWAGGRTQTVVYREKDAVMRIRE
jgi:hypothetical protein